MNIQSEAERKHEEILSKYVSPRHGVLTKENALKAMRELEESLSPASPVREALEKIVRAWESLPGNKNYAPKEIERWLGDVMSPAIDAAREALAARTEGDIASDAWDAGSASAYDCVKPEGACGFDRDKHAEAKTDYLNSIK
jgi:hypothetical protein